MILRSLMYYIQYTYVWMYPEYHCALCGLNITTNHDIYMGYGLPFCTSTHRYIWYMMQSTHDYISSVLYNIL